METTIIINQSLENCEVHRLLTKFYKVRVSGSTVKHSIIFPKDGLAYLVQPVCELTNTRPPKETHALDENVLKRIESFLRIHRHGSVFLTSAVFHGDEMIILRAVQRHFIQDNAIFLPTTGAAQCVSIIVDIMKPKNKTDLQRNALIKAKRISEGQLDEMDICNIIEKNLQVSSHEALVMQDGSQSLANLASCNKDDLMEYSLSAQVAKSVEIFFRI